MKTKKDIIEKLKSMIGQQITTESENYIVGTFMPEFDIRSYYMKGKCIDTREIISVSANRLVTRKVSRQLVGFDSQEEFAKDWFDRFLQSLVFHHATEEQVQYAIDKLTESFNKQLEDNILFNAFGFNDRIVCEFPPLKEITIEGDKVTMYATTFNLGGNQ